MKLNQKHTVAAACLSYVVQAIVNNLLPLLFAHFSGNYGISLVRLSLLIALNFGVQIATDLLSALFVDKIGYRRAVLLALFSATAGLILLAALPRLMEDTFLALLFPTILTAFGGGLLEVVVSPIVEAVPGEKKPALMGFLHSFYCWGQAAVILLSTLYFRAFGIENWIWLPLLWTVVPIVGALLFAFVPIWSLSEANERVPLGKLLSQKLFWALILLMLCSGASELAMAQWASLFAEVGLSLPKAVGDLLGPCAFALLMGIGRLLYSKFGMRVGIERYLVCSFALSAISYLLAVFAPHPFLSLLGCALCGFAAAPMWPGTYSLGAKRMPGGGTAMFALFALAGDLGCTLGPDLVGVISDRVIAAGGGAFLSLFGENVGTTALKVGLLFTALIPATALLVAVPLLIRAKKDTKDEKAG